MPHPHILNKSFTQITDTTRDVLERIYSLPSRSADDAHVKYNHARGVMDLWAELTFNMGASEHITVATQDALNQLVDGRDATELARWGLTPRQH